MSGIEIEGRQIEITNPDKILFPETGATKADLIDYYIRISPYILPYLKDRPFSMVPFPNGIHGKSFFQKQRPAEAPDWLKSVAIPSGERVIDYCLINDLPSLVFMANRACIEMHAWFSRAGSQDTPDVAFFDIDPSGDTGFAQAVEAALMIKEALDGLGIASFPKTSGKTGMHVCVPIEPVPYEKVRAFLTFICRKLVEKKPESFTLERAIAKRGNRVYLDAVQNGRGKTLPAPYSLRATPLANVSAPLLWDEVNSALRPEMLNISNIFERIEAKGDLFKTVYTLRQRLPV